VPAAGQSHRDPHFTDSVQISAASARPAPIYATIEIPTAPTTYCTVLITSSRLSSGPLWLPLTLLANLRHGERLLCKRAADSGCGWMNTSSGATCSAGRLVVSHHPASGPMSAGDVPDRSPQFLARPLLEICGVLRGCARCLLRKEPGARDPARQRCAFSRVSRARRGAWTIEDAVRLVDFSPPMKEVNREIVLEFEGLTQDLPGSANLALPPRTGKSALPAPPRRAIGQC
jgi:hypothetical protein